MQCPSHIVKLEKISNGLSQLCAFCGKTAKLQCRFCAFKLCDNCKICNKKHFLRRTVNLELIQSQYSQNNINCNSCKTNKKGNDNGIWHCNACYYDICSDCIP